MELVNILMIYLGLGLITGIAIESLMVKTNLNEHTSNLERTLWVILWPYFVIIFVVNLKK